MTTTNVAPRVHATAIVDRDVVLGARVTVWEYCHLFRGVRLGDDTRIGSHSVIGAGTTIGARCKVQNGCVLMAATVADEVFIGPRVCIVEDAHPRAVNSDGVPKGPSEWTHRPSSVGRGASLGAGAVILPRVHIGEFAMVAAGSVVGRSLPDFAFFAGNPGRIAGQVCSCGHPAHDRPNDPGDDQLTCHTGCRSRAAPDHDIPRDGNHRPGGDDQRAPRRPT